MKADPVKIRTIVFAKALQEIPPELSFHRVISKSPFRFVHILAHAIPELQALISGFVNNSRFTQMDLRAFPGSCTTYRGKKEQV